MSQETIVVKEVKTLKSGSSARGPWKLYGVLDGNDEVFATTFSDTIAETAKTFEGQKAVIAFTQDERGRTVESVEAASANGDTPALGTGDYIKGQTAPTDAARMARGAAWKALQGDSAIFKALLSAHSIEAPGQQLSKQNVLDIAGRAARYIASHIRDDNEIPF
jgi:hypothetical protein